MCDVHNAAGMAHGTRTIDITSDFVSVYLFTQALTPGNTKNNQ